MSFTADFSRYTNYNEQSNALIVRFAAGAPCLETEVNELQLISDKRFRDMAKIFGDGLYGNGSVSYVDNKLKISNYNAIVAGYIFYISNVEISLTVGETAYLEVYVKEVNIDTPMKKYGNEQETEINNYILDARFGKEISRREVLCYNLVKNNSNPEHFYYEIGTVTDDKFVTSAVISDGAMSKADEALEIANEVKKEMEEFSSSGISSQDIIIPTNDWGDSKDTEISGLSVDVSCDGVSETMIPIITINPVSDTVAQNCGFNARAKTGNGYIRFYAGEVPVQPINVTATLLSPSGNTASGEYVLLPATADRLGGVKIGDNLTITDDGTLSVKTDSLVSDVSATDEEAQEIIDKYF